MSDEQNPFAPPQAELQSHTPSTTDGGERSLEDAMAGKWSVSAGDIIKKAWDLKDGFKGVFIGATIIAGIAGGIASVISGLVTPDGAGQGLSFAISLVAGFIALPLTAPLQAGLWRMQIKRAAGGSPEIGEMFQFYDRVVPIVLVSLITALAVYIGILLLVIPGIYLSVASYLALPLVVERGLAPMEAFQTSIKTIGNHWFDVFVLGLLAAVVGAGGFFLFGIGAIWTLPTFYIAAGCLYVEVFGWEDKGA